MRRSERQRMVSMVVVGALVVCGVLWYRTEDAGDVGEWDGPHQDPDIAAAEPVRRSNAAQGGRKSADAAISAAVGKVAESMKAEAAKPPYVAQVPVPPDVRDPVCPAFVEKIRGRVKNEKIKLPNTSVIFCFCNEPSISLYHSIHSVIERSPPELLHEIILVDDGSNAPYIKDGPLEEYVAKLPVPVHIVRQNGRTGLMRARVAGARKATGDTLTFLDSHIDASRDWLEPMMYRIWEDESHIVMPIIDGLSRQFKYSAGGIELVGFNTKLVDHGIGLQAIHDFPGRDATFPQPSPAMAGGLFSVSRKYFFHIGAFDEDMAHWGGENIEIGFRAWQCGGSIELIACSRVAHVFGGMGGGCGWPGPPPGTKNKWRAIRIWMDEYADIMKQYLPEPADIGDLTKYQDLRKRLDCKSFQWFLDNVYPECWINVLKNPADQGSLYNKKENKCVNPRTHRMDECHAESEAKQRGHWLFLSRNNELILSDADTCLEAPTWADADLSLYGCHGKKGNQEWARDEATGAIKHGPGCLGVEDGKARVVKCAAGNPAQVWEFKKE